MNEVRNILVGIEIGKEQTSLAVAGRKDQEAELVPVSSSGMETSLPTCLAVIPGRNEFHAGFEAEYYVQHERAFLITDLTGRISRNESFEADDLVIGPVEMAAAFLRNVLGQLGLPDIVRGIAGLCITTESLTAHLALNLRAALLMLGFKEDRFFIQDHRESVYYYGYSRKAEYWTRGLGWIRISGSSACFAALSENRTVKPVRVEWQRELVVPLPEDPEERNRAFSEAVMAWTADHVYSSIYITGTGGRENFSASTIRILSQGAHHVYEGEELFVKGAALTVWEKLERKSFGNRLYAGRDQTRKTLGIDVITGKTQTFLPLIREGVNWYENRADIQILPEGRSDILMTVIDGRNGSHRNEKMQLDGLPERPDRTTRIRLQASMSDLHTCLITAEDLGFGELFPATHRKWSMEVEL